MKKKRISKAPEKRRAELITAARELFDLEGVEKTRVSDIVQKVGVAQGVFYYYFQSKEEMIETVLEEITEETQGDITEILHSDISVYHKIFKVLNLYLDYVDQFTTDSEDKLPDYKKMQEGAAGSARIRSLLLSTLTTLAETGIAENLIDSDYPVLTLKVLEAGFTRVNTTEDVPIASVYSIAEKALGIPRGALACFADTL